MKTVTKLWIGLAILIVLSPVGLLLPEHFKAGAAWGEWGVDEIQKLVGYIPQGLAKLSGVWNAPIPDYAFKGSEGKGLGSFGAGYIISALGGVSITAVILLVLGRLLTKKDEKK